MSTDSEAGITTISSKMQNILQCINTALGYNWHILLLRCNSFQKTQSNCPTKCPSIMYTSQNLIKPIRSAYLIFLLVKTNAFSPACNVVRNSVSYKKDNEINASISTSLLRLLLIYAPILVPCNTNTNFNITAETLLCLPFVA